MLCLYHPVTAIVQLRLCKDYSATDLQARMSWLLKPEEGGICLTGTLKQGKMAVLAPTSPCLGKSLATQKDAKVKRTVGNDVR